MCGEVGEFHSGFAILAKNAGAAETACIASNHRIGHDFKNDSERDFRADDSIPALIKQIQMTWATRHEQKDHVFCPRSDVGNRSLLLSLNSADLAALAVPSRLASAISPSP